MTIANAVKDAMLTAAFAGRTLMVGVFEGEQEVEANDYERQPVQFSEPQGVGDVRFVENVTEPLFDLGEESSHHLDRFAVFDEAGEFMGDFALLEARDFPSGDRAFMRPGTLKIGMP